MNPETTVDLWKLVAAIASAVGAAFGLYARMQSSSKAKLHDVMTAQIDGEKAVRVARETEIARLSNQYEDMRTSLESQRREQLQEARETVSVLTNALNKSTEAQRASAEESRAGREAISAMHKDLITDLADRRQRHGG